MCEGVRIYILVMQAGVRYIVNKQAKEKQVWVMQRTTDVGRGRTGE